MFTGIIEEMGTIKKYQKGFKSSVLTVQSKVVVKDIHIGDSIAVNGVCLTVTDYVENTFTVDVMHETINRTTLWSLKSGGSVNLERAIPVNGRFGGHIVTGHIDDIGIIANIYKDDNAFWYWIKANDCIMKYIVEKGSIAIDGISLTIAEVDKNSFSVSIIPHTFSNTILSKKSIGDAVNLENDILGKYVEKILSLRNPNSAKSNISKRFLENFGY